MGNSSRQKLNSLWFWISLFVGLIAGSYLISFSAAVVVFAVTYGILILNGDVRFSSRNGRGRRR